MFKAAGSLRVFLVPALLLLCCLILITFSLPFLEAFDLAALAPLQEGIESGRQGIVGIWQHYLLSIHASRENEELKQRIAELEAHLASVAEVELENTRMRALLEFRQVSELELISCRVVGRDATNWWHSVVVDRGQEDKVAVDCPAVLPSGVVGRVIRTGKGASRVQLLTDPASSVSCLIQQSRTTGIAVGTGSPAMLLKYVDQTEVISVGDPVLTSGLDGVYPKGLLVGYVSEVAGDESELFQRVVVVSVVDFGKLEELYLIRPSGAGGPEPEVEKGN